MHQGLTAGWLYILLLTIIHMEKKEGYILQALGDESMSVQRLSSKLGLGITTLTHARTPTSGFNVNSNGWMGSFHRLVKSGEIILWKKGRSFWCRRAVDVPTGAYDGESGCTGKPKIEKALDQFMSVVASEMEASTRKRMPG